MTEDFPESQVGRDQLIAYYSQMEQDGINMTRYARKRLGWLALGSDMPSESPESITEVLGGVNE